MSYNRTAVYPVKEATSDFGCSGANQTLRWFACRSACSRPANSSSLLLYLIKAGMELKRLAD